MCTKIGSIHKTGTNNIIYKYSTLLSQEPFPILNKINKKICNQATGRCAPIIYKCFTRDSWPSLCTQLSASTADETNITEKLPGDRGLLGGTLYAGSLKVSVRIDFHV